MRALLIATVFVLLTVGCAHHADSARSICPKCGTKLFFAIPHVTTPDEIRTFARGSQLADRDQIASSGWIHPGSYCPKADYSMRYYFKPQ